MINIEKEVNKILKDYDYKRTVPVLINGKFHYWDQSHMRAFQVLVNKNPDKYDEITSQITIYGGDPKIYNGTMPVRKDGKFVESFIKGYYDIDANLAFDIM